MPFSDYGPNLVMKSYKYLNHKYLYNYSHVDRCMTLVVTRGLRFGVDGWHMSPLLQFFMAKENIATCECIVVVSPCFMVEDQERVLQLSVLEVHLKFIIDMEGIVVIGFWRLDLGTFWCTIATRPQKTIMVQFDNLLGGGCLPPKSCYARLLACFWCSFSLTKWCKFAMKWGMLFDGIMNVIEFLGLNGYCSSNAWKINMELDISLNFNCLFQLLFISSYYWVLCRSLEKDKHGLGMIIF